VGVSNEKAGREARPFLVASRRAAQSPLLPFSAEGSGFFGSGLARFLGFAAFGGAGVSSKLGLSSLMLTCTSPPFASYGESSSSARGCLIAFWLSRAIGRAPIILS